MGNQSSSPPSDRNSSTRPPLRKFLRGAGTLGLSKAELDRRCKPSGLYTSCKWDEKVIRKLVSDGKLAARLSGAEAKAGSQNHECPICFLNYVQVNVTQCCQASICTECYLQVRPQKEKNTTCPFCNHNRVSVSVLETTETTILKTNEQERQTPSELPPPKLNPSSNIGNEKKASTAEIPESAGGFGSTLEKNERVAALRARSYSATSDNHNNESDSQMISALAMTPEERRQLEDEMKAQQLHPLSLRLEQEEAERRLENEQTYNRTQSGRLQELRARRELMRARLSHNSAQAGSDVARLIESMSSSGTGRTHSVDDQVVLEAALMLSREEARGQNIREFQGEDDLASLFAAAARGDRGLATASMMMSEEEQIRRAIEASLQDSSTPADSSSAGSNTDS